MPQDKREKQTVGNGNGALANCYDELASYPATNSCTITAYQELHRTAATTMPFKRHLRRTFVIIVCWLQGFYQVLEPGTFERFVFGAHCE